MGRHWGWVTCGSDGAQASSKGVDGRQAPCSQATRSAIQDARPRHAISRIPPRWKRTVGAAVALPECFGCIVPVRSSSRPVSPTLTCLVGPLVWSPSDSAFSLLDHASRRCYLVDYAMIMQRLRRVGRMAGPLSAPRVASRLPFSMSSITP